MSIDRDQLRRLLEQEARANAATWEHHGRVPRAILRRLADSGLLARGKDRSLARLLAVAEALPHSGSRRLTQAVIGQLLVMRYVDRHGGNEHRKQLLEALQQGRTLAAPALPQDVGQLVTWGVHAERQDEHWLISGSCPIFGGAGECDLVLVAAVTRSLSGDTRPATRTDPPPPRRPHRRVFLSLLLLDMDNPGISLQPPHANHRLRLQGCAVPQRCLLGERGRGDAYLAEQQPVLQLLVAAATLTVADLARHDLADNVADNAAAALAAMIDRARKSITRAAAKEGRPRSFQRACARAERRCRRVVEQLQCAQLDASGSWGLLDRCWQGISIRPEPSQRTTQLPFREHQAEVTPARTEAPGPRPSPEQLLTSLPRRFRAERAAGWAATFHFVLTGADQPEWTVSISDGTCRVEEGLHGDPGCVVRMKAATYLGIEHGETSPQAAFLTGRIKISNPALMMRFVKLFRPFTSGPGTGTGTTGPGTGAG